MKKLVLLVLLCAAFVMVGCETDMESGPRGVLQRRVERDRRIAQSMDIQKRSMVDDLDYIWFFDHVSQLNEGYLYCGW